MHKSGVLSPGRLALTPFSLRLTPGAHFKSRAPDLTFNFVQRDRFRPFKEDSFKENRRTDACILYAEAAYSRLAWQHAPFSTAAPRPSAYSTDQSFGVLKKKNGEYYLIGCLSYETRGRLALCFEETGNLISPAIAQPIKGSHAAASVRTMLTPATRA
jgi:hypothetical protein